MILRFVLCTVIPLLGTRLHQTDAGPSPLVVRGPQVIFFGPGPAERDSIVRAEGMEMAQLFDDFDYYAGRTGAFLRARGIGAIVTSSLQIVVKLDDARIRALDRRALPDLLGAILTDGRQDPRIIPGIATDTELLDECRSFFRLK